MNLKFLLKRKKLKQNELLHSEKRKSWMPRKQIRQLPGERTLPRCRAFFLRKSVEVFLRTQNVVSCHFPEAEARVCEKRKSWEGQFFLLQAFIHTFITFIHYIHSLHSFIALIHKIYSWLQHSLSSVLYSAMPFPRNFRTILQKKENVDNVSSLMISDD